MDAKERTYVRDVVLPAVRDPEERAALATLAHSVGRAEATGVFPARVAERLTAAVRSKSAIVRSHGCRWLFRFATRHGPAADLIQESFRSGSSRIRLSIVQSITFNDVPNEPLERVILTAALKDPTPAVRTFAANRVMKLGWRDMVGDVAAAEGLASGRDRENILFSLGLFRDGYILNRGSPDASPPRLLVKHRHGMTEMAVPAAVLNQHGPAEVARRIRLREEWPHPAPEPPGTAWDPVPDPEDASKNAGLGPHLVAARLAFAAFESSGTASAATV